MEPSFDRIVIEYQHKVYRLALSILNDQALAEDAAQESFVRIWRGLPSFRGQSALGTWIYSITRNTSLNILESRRAALRLPDDAGNCTTPRPARATVDVEALLAQLPARYAQVIRLYYLEEKSYEEVSSMLDLPLGTVKTFLHRARRELAAAALAGSTVKEG
ncbi:MAG: sigma-70 family RNA polymerase sigma factor [Acidobacteria bacterium]|nr:sigma-70 family RNA polymerase sigma factor [Acidobacteriota bacterium]